MKALRIAVLLLAACTSTAPPIALPPPSPSPAASPIAIPSPTASSSPRPDLTIVAAGEIRGDHALVLQESLQNHDGALPEIYSFWDASLDGTAPSRLLSYIRGDRLLVAADRFDFSRQLSPDGRRLVLADPTDVAGIGLLVVDLIAGTTQLIRTGGADQPTWSPDGQRIAYRGYSGQFTAESGVWVVGSTGGSPRLLLAAAPSGGGPTSIYGWTEDGAGLVVGRDPRTDLSVIDLATGSPSRVGGATYGAAWRAKRPSVVIVLEDQSAPGAQAGQVEVRDTTFAQPKVVARFGSEGSVLVSPRWNPRTDEVMLFWACGEGVTQRAEVVIVDVIRATRRALATPVCVRAAAWNRDGTKILYSDFGALRVMNADGSGDHELFGSALQVTAFAPH